MLPGSAISSAFVHDPFLCFRDAALFVSYNSYLVLEFVCSHKHFASNERESETLDETSWPHAWPMWLAWLTFTSFTG
jgi:hypothetical protein